MDYRVLPRGGEKISVIGMGSSVIGAQPEKEIVRTVRAAVDHGINYLTWPEATLPSLKPMGKRCGGFVAGCTWQVHFGADYTTGAYGWTTDLAQIKNPSNAAPKAWHGLH